MKNPFEAPPELSAEEIAKAEKTRTISDAEFLKGGAEYKVGEDGNKRLEVTDDQMQEARKEMGKDLYANKTPEELKKMHLEESFNRTFGPGSKMRKEVKERLQEMKTLTNPEGGIHPGKAKIFEKRKQSEAKAIESRIHEAEHALKRMGYTESNMNLDFMGGTLTIEGNVDVNDEIEKSLTDLGATLKREDGKFTIEFNPDSEDADEVSRRLVELVYVLPELQQSKKTEADTIQEESSGRISKMTENSDAEKIQEVRSQLGITKSVTEGESNKEGQNFKIGDAVQWTSQGVAQFDKPRKIEKITDDGEWAFVEGAKTGIPFSQLSIEKISEEKEKDVESAGIDEFYKKFTKNPELFIDKLSGGKDQEAENSYSPKMAVTAVVEMLSSVYLSPSKRAERLQEIVESLETIKTQAKKDNPGKAESGYEAFALKKLANEMSSAEKNALTRLVREKVDIEDTKGGAKMRFTNDFILGDFISAIKNLRAKK